MNLTYEDYKKKVISAAFKRHKKPVCIDSLREMYDHDESIEDAVEQCITDTLFWEIGT